MANYVSKFTINNETIDVKDATARTGVTTNSNHIGNLSSLNTTDKSSLVAAVNEVKGGIPSGATYNSTTETITL